MQEPSSFGKIKSKRSLTRGNKPYQRDKSIVERAKDKIAELLPAWFASRLSRREREELNDASEAENEDVADETTDGVVLAESDSQTVSNLVQINSKESPNSFSRISKNEQNDNSTSLSFNNHAKPTSIKRLILDEFDATVSSEAKRRREEPGYSHWNGDNGSNWKGTTWSQAKDNEMKSENSLFHPSLLNNTWHHPSSSRKYPLSGDANNRSLLSAWDTYELSLLRRPPPSEDKVPTVDLRPTKSTMAAASVTATTRRILESLDRIEKTTPQPAGGNPFSVAPAAQVARKMKKAVRRGNRPVR